MTDEFEDLIRNAGRGLGTAGETPTYHAAWKRGQRRRLVKRAAITAAGACALVVAFSASVGQFGISESTEVAEVETNAVVATSTPEAPTTAPVVPEPPITNNGTPAPDLDVPTATAVPGTADDLDPSATASIVIPIPTPEPPSTVEVVESTPVPDATQTPATPTPIPTAEATPEPTATPAADIRSSATDPDASFAPSLPAETSAAPDAATTTSPDPVTTTGDDADDGGDTDDGGADDDDTAQDDDPGELPDGGDATPTTPARTGGRQPAPPPVASVGPGTVDAVITGQTTTLARANTQPCDTDFDGVADATCELLVEYSCSAPGEATEGFTAADTDGDGVIDTCVPTGDLMCEVTVRGGSVSQACLIDFGR